MISQPQDLLLLLKKVEKTWTFTQKWLDHLLLMMSYLVTIETYHYCTWLKMRTRDERTATEKIRYYVLSSRRKFRKTLEGRGLAPLVRPRVKTNATESLSDSYRHSTNDLLTDSSKKRQLQENDWTTDHLTNNKRLFSCDNRLIEKAMSLWVFIANNYHGHQLTWYNSLWLWRWLPYSFTKKFAQTLTWFRRPRSFAAPPLLSPTAKDLGRLRIRLPRLKLA